MNENNKISIDEYIKRKESEYKNLNNKKGKVLFHLAFGILLILCIFFVFDLFAKYYAINKYLGYGVLAISILLIFFLIFFPLIRISKLNSFTLEFGRKDLKKVKDKNKNICFELRKKILEYEDNVDTSIDENLYNLLKNANSNNIEEVLYQYYDNEVKKKAKLIIKKYSKKCGLYTAISQTETKDALIVAAINIAMMKELIYLYGFSPSEAKMSKIMLKILKNVLASIGLNELPIGTTVSEGLAKLLPSSFSFVSKIFGKVVESIGQGALNSFFINMLGKETIRYLIGDYKLQYDLALVDVLELNEKKEDELNLSDEEMNDLANASEKENKKLKEEVSILNEKLKGANYE